LGGHNIYPCVECFSMTEYYSDIFVCEQIRLINENSKSQIRKNFNYLNIFNTLYEAMKILKN